MWSALLCILLTTPVAFSKSVKDGRQEDKPVDLGDLSSLFVRQEPSPILNGPSTAEGVPEDFSALFTSSGASDADSSDKFVETVKLAAKEFEEKRAMEKSKRDNSPSNVVTCVYCDARCVAQTAASGYSTPQEYFTVAINEMTRIVQESLDPNMAFSLTYVLMPNSVNEMSWFFDYSATTAEELLTAINNKFWDGTGLYNTANSFQCDVDFLVGAPSDPAWMYMGAVQGIANMFQLCLGSYSTVEMNANPMTMARLMTHEFGHMIGIYHDGALNAAFTGMASYFEPGQVLANCQAEFGVLQGACTDGDSGCTSGRCIMAPTIDGTEFSGCSQAYYDMYICLTDAMPDWYSNGCTKN